MMPMLCVLHGVESQPPASTAGLHIAKMSDIKTRADFLPYTTFLISLSLLSSCPAEERNG